MLSVVWDGKDQRNKRLGAGVFLVKIKIGNKASYKNLILAE